jgi:hypothetical protein
VVYIGRHELSISATVPGVTCRPMFRFPFAGIDKKQTKYFYADIFMFNSDKLINLCNMYSRRGLVYSPCVRIS